MRRLLIPCSTRHAFFEGVVVAIVFQILLFSGAAVAGKTFLFGGPPHDGYLELANNLAAGNGYVFEPGGTPVMHRPPAYPFLLALLAWLPDTAERCAVIVLQSLFAGGLAALAFYNGQIWFGARTAAWAALFVIVNPWVNYTVKNPMSAHTQAILYTAFFTLGTAWASRGSRGKFSATHLVGYAVALGVVGGLVVLSHGAMILSYGLAVGFVGALAVVVRRWQILAALPIAAALSAAVVAPWTFRNWQVTGRFVPIVSNAGLNYFLGTSHWDAPLSNDTVNAAALRYAGMDPTLEDRIYYQGLLDQDLQLEINDRMKRHVRTRRLDVVRITALDAAEFYFPVTWCVYRTLVYNDAQSVKQWVRMTALSVFYLFQWALALVGGVWVVSKRQAWLPYSVLLAGIVCYVLPYLPVIVWIGHQLYAFGTLPFLAVLAAATCSREGVEGSAAGHEIVPR